MVARVAPIRQPVSFGASRASSREATVKMWRLMTTSFLAPSLLILVQFASGQDAPDVPVDPEAEARGRTHFLGREIARTMHWLGADWLLRETREDEENGARLREYLDVASPQVICDLGCGNGYHALPLAEAVAPDGRVLAVDLQPEMLTFLEDRATERGVENVERILATLDDPRLPEGAVDLCLLVDVYHELSHPVSVMGHVRRALKPGGRVVLVEFRAEDPRVPIKPLHKMTKAQVVNEMAALGFACVEEFDGLPWQHVLAFEAADVEPFGGVATGSHAAREVGLGALRSRVRGDAAGLAAYLDEGFVALPDEPLDAAGWLERAEGDPVPTASGFHFHAGADRAWLHAAAAGWRETLRLRADPEEPGRWRVDGWARAPGLVAMNTATGRGTPVEQVALAGDLGYAGIGWGIWRTAEVRAACDERGMRLESVYVVLDVAQDPDAREAQLAEAMRDLPPGGAVWLALESSAHETSDPAGDAAARATIERVAERVELLGHRVALYPHHGSWLESFEDALRLAEAVDREDVGVAFNLCHWLRNRPGAPDPAPALARAGERLFAVTLNGADREGEDWPSLIQPLDRGTHDLGPLLDALGELGFRGPFALQGFGLKEPTEEHLLRSLAAWWRACADR